jgi:hypothetical protein
MASSGIAWIDWLYDLAVHGLYDSAALLGITYEEINVWLFCVAWPLTMLLAALWIFQLRRRVRLLRKCRAVPPLEVIPDPLH